MWGSITSYISSAPSNNALHLYETCALKHLSLSLNVSQNMKWGASCTTTPFICLTRSRRDTAINRELKEKASPE